MQFKRILSVTVALILAVGSLALAQQAPAQKAPKLTIVDPVRDFGVVPKGEKLTHAFQIKNTGEGDLQILSAQPACGCTVAEFDKVIKPGQTGKVEAVVETINFSGPISKPVTIQTNDPNTPTAQLTINAVVKPYVEAHPAGFVRFSNLLQGEAATQSVTLYSEEEEPFQITSIEVPGPHVKTAFRKIENEADRVKAGRSGQNQYRVDITFGGPDARVGPIAEKIKIHTNSKRQPEYAVSITGLVRPTYSVIPTVLNFSEVAPTDPSATRTIMVQSNDRSTPGQFKITKVETTNPAVSAEAKATETPGRYEVTVKVAKDAKAGMLDGDVKIYTSDKINPVFTLPVKGIVKG